MAEASIQRFIWDTIMELYIIFISCGRRCLFKIHIALDKVYDML